MTLALPPRVRLVHAPTPLERHDALDEIVGARVWVKRDDMTAGAEAGNKLRKLELLAAAARERGATTLVTCGALQSNHARATALVAARLSMKSVLLLRVADPEAAAPPSTGNLLLDRLVGADIRPISPEAYGERVALLEAVRREIDEAGERAYVIPEGGSNGLGALGYVAAMGEVREQLDVGLGGGSSYDVVVHACGSGGTAAGVALGAAHFSVARAVRPVVVCDDAAYFTRVIERIAAEARGHAPELGPPVAIHCDEAARGPRYGAMSEDQLALLVRVARATGLVLDPVYTGKAMAGLVAAVARGDIARDARVLFLHTGGLPGLLAETAALEGVLAP